MVNMMYAVIGAVFMVTMALFALLKGGNTEKAGASAYLMAWFASLVVQQESPRADQAPHGVFFIDLILLAVFAVLALRSNRAWPIWAGAIQLLTVLCHLILLMNGRTPVSALFTIMNLNGYLIIICLTVGTFWVWQERKAATEHQLGRNS